MVEFYKLARIFSFIDVVCKTIGERHGSIHCVAIVGWDDVGASVVTKGDTPHVGLHITPPSDDSFSVETDISAYAVTKNLTPFIADEGD